MSKTDKTRPFKIREFFEGEIRHNHTSGECRVETLSDAKMTWRQRNAPPPKHDCPRWLEFTEPCEGAALSDIRKNKYARYSYASGACYHACVKLDIEKARVDSWVDHGYSGAADRFYCRYRNDARLYCDGPHTRRVFDRRIPCEVCESVPLPPTCEYSMERPHSYWMGSAPHEYRQWFHRENRRNERDTLNNARRDYNANGDTDIEPVDRHHRHSANWYYW